MKRKEQSQQSRLKIINAALDEFGKLDYFTASTNSICKNHGISKGLLFHYFTSKDELFMVCVSKCFDELGVYIEEKINVKGETIEEILGHYVEGRMEFFKAYPHYKKIFHTAMFNTPPHLVDEIEEAKSRLNHGNQVFLTKALEELNLKEGINKAEVINVLIDFANFIFSKHKSKEELDDNFKKKSIDEFNQIVKMLFYGIIQG